MRVLVTGGAGFIGSHIVETHLDRGNEVFVVDDLSTGSGENVELFKGRKGYSFKNADLVTWDGLERQVAWADRIYNMAAVVGMFRVLKEPVSTTRVNVIGCERVLEAAIKAEHKPVIVHPSSSSVCGPAKYEDLHEDAEIVASPDAPLLNYALSKLGNEVQCRAYHEEHGLQAVAARLFNTIGLRQGGLYGFVVPRFVQQALAGEPMTIFGDGSQTRSFCDVRDTVAILDRLAETQDAYGDVVNVGNTQEITIRELAELVRDIVGSKSELTYVPYEVAYGKSFAQIPQRRPILDKLKKLTGYEHKWKLADTIDDLARHYRAQGIGVDNSSARPVAA